MTADPSPHELTPQPPTPAFTRLVRTGVVLYGVALVALGTWNIVTTVPLPWFSTPLSMVSGWLTGTAAVSLWRWAARPRLTQFEQHIVAKTVRGEDRRAMSRAVRQGGMPPAHLETRALPYVWVQQQLTPSGWCMVLVSAGSLISIATEPRLHLGGWIMLGLASSTLVIGAGSILWARRVSVVAVRWSGREEVAPPSLPRPQRVLPGSTPPTVPWRDGEPRFDTDEHKDHYSHHHPVPPEERLR